MVDDDDEVLKIVGAHFESLGVSFDLASGGPEAIRLLNDRDYQLVIADLKMPVVGGLQVLACTKRVRPRATRVLLSGDPASLWAAGSQDSLADFMLYKPLDFAKLRDIVTSVLKPGVAPHDRHAETRELWSRIDEVRRRYDDSTDTVFIKSNAGRYLYMNARGFELLGRAADQVIGRLDADIFDEATLLEEVRASDQEVLRTGRRYLYTNTMRVGGQTLTAMSVKVPMHQDDGSVVAIGCLSRDVTKLLTCSRMQRRQHVRELLWDVAELREMLSRGMVFESIEIGEVEACLQLPGRVPDRIVLAEAEARAAEDLRQAGYQVVEMASSPEAWSYLEREGDGVDAVVTNDGSLAFQIRRRWPGIRVLAASTQGLSAVVARALEA